LAQLVQSFIKKTETDYTDSEHATALEGLKEKLSKLKKFSKDGENSAVYNGLSETDKKTFDALVNKLQEKVSAMEKEANKGNQNPSNNNPEKS